MSTQIFVEKGMCSYFNESACRSCTRLGFDSRLPDLPNELLSVGAHILPWVQSPRTFHYRTKARFSVSGTMQAPIIGILDKELRGVELLSCPVHRNILNAAVSDIKELLPECKIEPYDIHARKGELKSIIMQTNAREDSLRIRFVCNSICCKESLEKASEALFQRMSSRFSSLKHFFSSLNIQPIPHQIPEGDVEITLSGEGYIQEQYANIPVFFPATSFMQVNPEVTSHLYSSACTLIKELPYTKVLDLFCGAGGFSLVCGVLGKQILGVEIDTAAVDAATYSARFNSFDNITFKRADLLNDNQFLASFSPEILICNPPRRGLGELVLKEILRVKPEAIVYSSCNYVSLINDYSNLKEVYTLESIQPFEMFPLTNHFEVLAFLHKK